MKQRNILSLTFTVIFVLSLSGVTLGQGKNEGARDLKDEIKQSQKAAQVFTEIMQAPDKAIPQDILDDAECVAVFPDVLKAGFIVGGRGVRGLAACHVGNSWSEIGRASCREGW